MKQKLTFMFMFVLMLLSLQAQQSKLRVAVFDPTASGTNIDEGTKLAVQELISSALVSTGKFTVVERSMIEKIIKEQSFQSSDLADNSQATEIGRLSGANKVVLSAVSLVGGRNMLSIKLVDVETASIDLHKTKIVESNDLLDVVEPLTLELLGEKAVYKKQGQEFIGNAPTTTVQKNQPTTSQQKENASRSSSGKNIVFTVNGVEFEMIFVDGGTFIMGCTPEQKGCGKEEKPTHSVSLSDFYMGKYEVTQKLWHAVMGVNIRHLSNLLKKDVRGEGDDYPMYYVRYSDCEEFCGKLNRLLSNELPDGYRFSIPTEAQWEYAARGGKNSRSNKYSGSNNIDEVSWYSKNSGNKTREVGLKRSNELDIYDMSGNVWEWCQDWGGNYGKKPQTNPKGPNKGSYRVIRGGSSTCDSEYGRVSCRRFFAPSNHDYGLRLVLTP
jgi:formylglycine-generating enzyme required for sulfatase activity